MDVFEQSHFALLGLSERFAIDLQALQAAYLKLQAVVHPDRFASGGAAQRRMALQAAMRVNEAYRTLLDPGQRATYLCDRHGVAVHAERTAQTDPAFLMMQMEWREALQNARQVGDRQALAALKQALSEQRAHLLAEMAQAIDEQADYPRAAEAVRRWMFIDKFGADVAAAEDGLAA